MHIGHPIRIGMVGAGHIARSHARAWQQEAALAAICSRQRRKAEALARAFDIPVVCDTPGDLIARPDVDAVSIATPHHLHYAIAMQAMAAGKHVFCEKPLALNMQQARAMWACAQKTGVRTGMQSGIRTAFPGLRHLHRLIHEGRLGPVQYFEGVWGFDWAHRPDYPMGWRFKRQEAGTGALGDLGVYMIDAARWLIGEITSVCADFATHIRRRPVIPDRYDFAEVRRMHREGALPEAEGMATVENEDACTLMLRFAGGAQGYIRASRLHRNNTIKVEGAQAGYAWTLSTGQLMRRLPGEEAYTAVSLPDDLPAESMVTRFLDNIRYGTDHPPTFLDGLRAQEIIDAAIRSNAQRRWVRVK
jgi:predicted dehydrogenase